jgi:hypothetical protein
MNLEQRKFHSQNLAILAKAQIVRNAQDMKLMAAGICPQCHFTDTDEIYVPGEFPNQGYFKFRCNRKGCEFESGK